MKIVGTGLVCLDIVYQNKDFALMLGGTCANVLTVLSQLGEDVTVLVPDYDRDDQKEYFYEMFNRLDVEYLVYCKTKKSIPRIIEVFDENKNHLFCTKCPYCGTSLLEKRFITEEEAISLLPKIAVNDIFFTDRISSGIKYIAAKFGDAGKMVFYEPNSGRNLNAVIEMSRLASVVKFSSDKIGMEAANIILEKCQNSPLKLMIITQGEKGMYFSYRTDAARFSEWKKGPEVEFIGMRDTSGAGDWLTAGFLHFWCKKNFSLKKAEIFDALEKALELSAICSMKAGAQGVFYDSELFDYLKKKYGIKLRDRIGSSMNDIKGMSVLICNNCFKNLIDR